MGASSFHQITPYSRRSFSCFSSLSGSLLESTLRITARPGLLPLGGKPAFPVPFFEAAAADPGSAPSGSSTSSPSPGSAAGATTAPALSSTIESPLIVPSPAVMAESMNSCAHSSADSGCTSSSFARFAIWAFDTVSPWNVSKILSNSFEARRARCSNAGRPSGRAASMSFASFVAWYALASPCIKPNCFRADARTFTSGPEFPNTPGRISSSGCAPMCVFATSFFPYSSAFCKLSLGNIVPPLRPPFGGFFVAGLAASAIGHHLASFDRLDQFVQPLVVGTSEICIQFVVDAVGHLRVVELDRQHRDLTPLNLMHKRAAQLLLHPR